MEYLPDLVKIMAVCIVGIGFVMLVGKAWGEVLLAGASEGAVSRFFHKLAYRPKTVEGFKPLSPLRLWQTIIGLFIATRLMIFAAAYGYAAFTGELKSSVYTTLVGWFYEYDSYHYVNIATFGYQSVGEDQNLIVFYPLYPALIRLVHFIVPDYLMAGAAVSNLFLLIGLYYLVRLVELEWQDTKLATASAKYLVLFPFSFFFSILYTESVFVTLCILCFYFLRKSRWFAAGVMALLASLTRNQGVLLAMPIVIEMAVQMNWRNIFKAAGVASLIRRALIPAALVALMPGFGIFIYLFINKWVTGDWFRFLFHQRDHWEQTFGFFADNLKEHMYRALNYKPFLFAVGVYLPQLVLFFVSFGLLIYMTNKIRLSYFVYSFAYLIISYSPTTLLSGARYVSGMFTLYLFLAYIARKFSSSDRPYLDWCLLFFLLFYSVVFGLNYVF